MVHDSIVYDGGFAVTWTPEMAGDVIKSVANIKLVPVDTAEQAYLYGARAYFKREYWGNPGIRQPMMPPFEKIREKCFLRPNVVPQIPAERHFVAIYGDAVAYLRSVENIVEFLREFPWGFVSEVHSAFEALKAANYHYYRQFMGFGAYIGSDIPMIRTLPANAIAETSFSSWWQEQRAAIPAQLTPSRPLKQIVDVTPVETRRKVNGNA